MKTIRGMRDLLYPQSNIYQQIILLTQQIATQYSFEFIRSPVVEETSLFIRNLGFNTDVVSKELYSFLDKSNNNISLRPEFTASMIRSFETNNFIDTKYLFTYGPLFRYDRPQKGRYREFYQANYEIMNTNSYSSDIIIISIAQKIFDTLNIKVKLHINTLGTLESRKLYNNEIEKFFTKHYEQLSTDNKNKFNKKAFLRILDSKENQDLIKQIPFTIYDFISAKEKKFFDNIKNALNKAKIDFYEDPLLVRGLDYYNNTIFEFIGEDNLALAGGGRYGVNKDISAVGFALGVDRILNMTNLKPTLIIEYGIFLLDSAAEEYFFSKLNIFNKLSYRLFNSKNISTFFKHAERANCKKVIIIGVKEVNSETFEVKDLYTKHKEQYTLKDLYNY